MLHTSSNQLHQLGVFVVLPQLNLHLVLHFHILEFFQLGVDSLCVRVDPGGFAAGRNRGSQVCNPLVSLHSLAHFCRAKL